MSRPDLQYFEEDGTWVKPPGAVRVDIVLKAGGAFGMPAADDSRTPWQVDRDRAEETGAWPGSWGPFHRHFANDAVHRDGGPECDQPGTPRRVYVFDPDALAAHEAAVAQWVRSIPAADLPELVSVEVGKGGRPGGRDGYALIITHLKEGQQR